jgi:hypothetical protein
MSWCSASASKVERVAFAGLLLAAVVGCEGEPCAVLPESCTPLYEPTFANVHANTLGPSCAVGGASCHTSEAQQAGLDFSTLDAAHASLLRALGSKTECSPLLVRLESTEQGFSMPPGKQLPAEERCAVRRYLEAGAPR